MAGNEFSLYAFCPPLDSMSCLGENPPRFMEKPKVWNEAVIKYSWSCYLCFGCERLCQICESMRVFHSAYSGLLSSGDYSCPQLNTIYGNSWNLVNTNPKLLCGPFWDLDTILGSVLYSQYLNIKASPNILFFFFFFWENVLLKLNYKNVPLHLQWWLLFRLFFYLLRRTL